MFRSQEVPTFDEQLPEGRGALEVIYGDILVHYLAVTKFGEGKPLNRNEQSFLRAGQTNATVYADFLGLMDNKLMEGGNTYNKCPLALTHKTLIQETKKEYDKIRPQENITQETFNAAVHKLASYLAILDQATLVAKDEGKLVSKNTTLSQDSEFMRNLALEYGGKFPGIAELYEMALEAVRKYSKPGDLLIEPILEQGMLSDERFA